jgi:hypothetical protein
LLRRDSQSFMRRHRVVGKRLRQMRRKRISVKSTESLNGRLPFQDTYTDPSFAR